MVFPRLLPPTHFVCIGNSVDHWKRNPAEQEFDYSSRGCFHRLLAYPGRSRRSVRIATLPDSHVLNLVLLVKLTFLRRFAVLMAVRPEFAIISVGEENPYGHPNKELLQRLQDAGVTILRTERNGAIHVLTDGEKLEFSCFLGCLDTSAMPMHV